MRSLTRRVGLGLAARGDVSDVIDWTRRARDAGLDSVWIHDSYYERDAITYGVRHRRAPWPTIRTARSGWPWAR